MNEEPHKANKSLTVKDILATDSAGPSLKLAFHQALAWAVMFGAGEASLALFANHLNAPLFVYGFLVGVPSLLGPLSQVIAANLLDKFKNRVLLIFIPVLIQSFIFLPLIFIPFLAPESDKALSIDIIIFLIAVTIYFITGHLATPAWSSLISELVPEKSRSTIFAWISRAPTLVALIAQLVVGVGLYFSNNKEQAGIVFAAAFTLSFVARIKSAHIIQKIKAPPYEFNLKDSFNFWQFIKRAPHSNFVKFVIFSSFLTLGTNIAAPYFLPYWTNDLGYKQWEWVLLASAGTVSSIITMMAWGRFSEIFGNRQSLKICAIIISLTPFCWLLTENIYWLFVIQMLGTIFWTGFNLSSFNYILEAATPPKRARCIAYYNILLGIGALLGSFIGYMSSIFIPKDFLGLNPKSSFTWILIVSATFRIIACIIFMPKFKELREVSTFNIRSFFIQVINIRSIYGIRFIIHENDEIDNDSNMQDKRI